MGKSNTNWEPGLKDAYKKQKKSKLGIDANDDERISDLAKTAKNKKGPLGIIAIIIIVLILVDAFLMQGEIFINILKNLLGN